MDQGSESNDILLEKVEKVMLDSSKHSWELGVEVQALLEFHTPDLTPWSSSYSSSALQGKASEIHPAIARIAKQVYDDRPSAEDQPSGKGKVLWKDGAVGDPAALILPLLVTASSGGEGGDGMMDAISRQVDFVLHDAPKTDDGAISHRMDQVQLWADFVYMVPPTFALWALHHPDRPNKELLQWSIDQCRLQRSYYLIRELGLWKHIVLGTGKLDPDPWATSNAWAAAGMLRVLATVLRSPWAGELRKEAQDLQVWVEEILDGATLRTTRRSMILNYIDDRKSFEESCGTALLAATAFRLAQLKLTDRHANWAQNARQTLLHEMIDDSGKLLSVSDIHDEHIEGGRDLSPEGQAFVLLMEAAWRDWQAAGGDDSD